MQLDKVDELVDADQTKIFSLLDSCQNLVKATPGIIVAILDLRRQKWFWTSGKIGLTYRQWIQSGPSTILCSFRDARFLTNSINAKIAKTHLHEIRKHESWQENVFTMTPRPKQ